MDLWICVRFAPPGVLEVPQLGRGGQGIQGAHAAEGRRGGHFEGWGARAGAQGRGGQGGIAYKEPMRPPQWCTPLGLTMGGRSSVFVWFDGPWQGM